MHAHEGARQEVLQSAHADKSHHRSAVGEKKLSVVSPSLDIRQACKIDPLDPLPISQKKRFFVRLRCGHGRGGVFLVSQASDGFGEAVEQTTATTTYSPAYGTTTQMWTERDAKNVMKAGAGKGVSHAAKELQKFYLQLAEQTLPVIEVGATKSVTLVISEGADLEIKKENTRI